MASKQSVAKSNSTPESKKEVSSNGNPLDSRIRKATNPPKGKRGRKAIDLQPIIDRLQEIGQYHIMDGITSEKEFNRHARWVREAAKKANLECSVQYVPEEDALYFVSYELGTRPARGRRRTSVTGTRVD